MLIVIEGSDKTGKTTLAKEISRKLGFEYHHFGPPGKDPAKEYAEFLINLKRPTVCDRFFYGELVYGPLLRKGSIITPLQKAVIERLCRLRGAILIHARTPLSVVTERMKVMGDDLITIEQNEKAYEMFEEVLKTSTLPKLEFSGIYNISYEKFVAGRFTFMALDKKRIGLRAAEIATGIGTIDKPWAVIVGEKLNQNATWLGLPFDAGSCSEYLNDCINKSEVIEKDLYFVNSNTITEYELEFLYLNGAARFVALGKVASEVLARLDVKHTMIPHPSYWKRFHSTETEAYIKILEEAAC